MTKKPKYGLVASCGMYPENGKRWVDILVFERVSDLRRFAKKARIPGYSTLGGFCKSYGGQRRFAAVGLCKRYLTPRVVSHEFTHAALMYLSEVNDLPKDPWRDPNERLCHLVGNGTADFYCWAKDRGLY